MNNKITKKKILKELKPLIAVIVFTGIYGIGASWFLEASVVPLYSGGMVGISQLLRDIIRHIIGWEINASGLGIMVFLTNIPMLVFGWFKLSHRFTIYSGISVLIQTIVLGFIPQVDFGLSSANHVMVASVLGGLLIGIGGGGALRFGTSTGGLDIISQHLALKKGLSVGFFYTAMNVVIAVLGAFIIGGKTSAAGAVISGGVIVSYTVIRIIVTTITMDKVHTAYHFVNIEIVTKRAQVMAKEIMSVMGRGVTVMNVEGAYYHERKQMLYIIISRYEIHTLLPLIRRIDPDAFIISKPVKYVYGNFRKKRIT